MTTEHPATVAAVADHPFWRRVFGGLLAVYGLLGLVLVIGGAILATTSIPRLDGLATTISTQREVLVRSLDATATFLHDARTGGGNVQTSLLSTVDSARQTATLTRSLASAMNQIASASSITIFGQQPFGGLGATFADVSLQATTMGTSLDHTADALARNGADLTQVTSDLAAIETEISQLRTQVAGLSVGTDDLSGISRAIDASRIVLFVLLLWLGTQAAIALVVGLVLLRWSPAVVEVVEVPEEQPGMPLDDVI